MKLFKKITAISLAVATMATMTISASARTVWAGDKTPLAPTNTSLSSSVYDTTVTNKIKNGTVDELSWNFLNNERSTKNGRVDIKLNYNADAAAYKNDIIAVFYEGCIGEDAYIWSDGMVITDVNGRRVVAEVRKDYGSNRFALVNKGTFEGTYGNNMGNLLSSLMNEGKCEIYLHYGMGVYNGKVYAHNIKGKSSLTANVKFYKSDKYQTIISFYHRIAGMFVNSALKQDGKQIFNFRNTPRNAMTNDQLRVYYSDGYIQMANNKDYKQTNIIGFNFGTSAMNFIINLNIEESSNRKVYGVC